MSALDLDIGELFSKLFKKNGNQAEPPKSDNSESSSSVANYKHLIAPVVLLIGLGMFFYFYFLPEYRRVETIKYKAEMLPSLQLEMAGYTASLNKAERQLAETKSRYNDLTKLFHTEEELEDLYRHISTLALTNGLTITGLTKQLENPVLEKNEGNDDPSTAKEVAYFIVPMKVEFSGGYLNYVRFRDGLASINKLVNIDQETITVLQTPETQGMVEIKAVISTYRMPQRYLNLGK